MRCFVKLIGKFPQLTVKAMVACALKLLLSLAVITKVYVPATGRSQPNKTPWPTPRRLMFAGAPFMLTETFRSSGSVIPMTAVNGLLAVPVKVAGAAMVGPFSVDAAEILIVMSPEPTADVWVSVAFTLNA